MTDNTQQGGPGTGRGLPAPHSGDELFPDVLEELRRLTRPEPARSTPELIVRGVLRRAEVESQPLVLDAEDGTTYELHFPSEWRLHGALGDTVELHGTVMKGVATTAQIGPLLRVRSASSLGTSPKDAPMSHQQRFEDYTRALAESVARFDEVEGLVLLGSTASVDRIDEWSDHDFYLVVREGHQERFRNELCWLPNPEDIAFAVRETEHGLKVVYRSGAVLEFAVASAAEVSTFGGSPYAVVLDRANVAERMASAPTTPPNKEPDDLREFRLFLSLVLIGVGRARRGEELAGGQLVRTYAAERLLTVLRHRLTAESDSPEAEPDPFNVFRRFEAAFPDVGRALGDAMTLPVDDCGARLLGIAQARLEHLWPEYPADEAAVVRHRLGYCTPADAQL